MANKYTILPSEWQFEKRWWCSNHLQRSIDIVKILVSGKTWPTVHFMDYVILSPEVRIRKVSYGLM